MRQITEEAIVALLRTYFNQPIEDLAPIKPGHFAQVYGFCVDGAAYVIRAVTSTQATSFPKEQFIFTQLLSGRIPAPQNLHIGYTGAFHFAIAYRIPGVPLDSLPWSEHDAVLPELIALLDAIHQTDISRYTGYGYFDERGVAAWASWHTYLADIIKEEADDSFFGKWHALFDDTFLDKELFYRIYRQMIDYLPYCPEERHLLHGDYGFNNVLVENGRITGILDWSQAQYGDPLYEIARLDLWSPKTDYPGRFQEYYHAHNRIMHGYDQRIRCYQCHTILDAARFFAKQGDRSAYDWVLNRMRELRL